MKWPGNNIPVFRKNVEALKELNDLVEELAATCTYEPCGFTKEGIRKHILDTLNERRRRIKKGHDYTKVHWNDLAFFSLAFSILFFPPECTRQFGVLFLDSLNHAVHFRANY